MSCRAMGNLLVLTSPPASGKTFWIESFTVSIDQNILVISPLRALADECKEKWGERITVMTPEEWSIEQRQSPVVIFDEHHLHYYWGDTFRPLMWEVFYSLAYGAKLTILLTATLSPEHDLGIWSCHFDEIILCDHGNRRLKFAPDRYIKAPNKSWMRNLIEAGPRGEGANLIFCAYRNEVKEMAKALRLLGFEVWAFVGGEAHEMRKLMKTGVRPHYIVATSVLSHGVNLPAVSCIYLFYPLKNIDFWIQMVARGGRKGEKFEVIALESPHGISWSLMINHLSVLLVSLKMRLKSLSKELDQWFLKASS
jgi:superfamily II DNA or RNA helicase